MSLDQTLMEIEPIFRGTDGTFQFTHPSFQEILTAKQFADEINSGRLSVEHAWGYCWSYEMDADLWELPKDREWRVVLPAWKDVLKMLLNMLEHTHVERFVDIATKDFRDLQELNYDKFNPLRRGYWLALSLVEGSKFHNRMVNSVVLELLFDYKPGDFYCWDEEVVLAMTKLSAFGYSDLAKYIRNIRMNHRKTSNLIRQKLDRNSSFKATCNALAELLDYDDKGLREDLLYILTGLRYYDPRISDLLEHEDVDLKGAAIFTLGDIGHYDLRVRDMLEDKDDYVKRAAIFALAHLNQYDERIPDMLESKDESVIKAAVYALIEFGHYDERLLKLTKHPDEWVRYVAEDALDKLGHMDSGRKSPKKSKEREYTFEQLINDYGRDEPEGERKESQRQYAADILLSQLASGYWGDEPEGERKDAQRQYAVEVLKDMKSTHGFIDNSSTVMGIYESIVEVLEPKGYNPRKSL